MINFDAGGAILAAWIVLALFGVFIQYRALIHSIKDFRLSHLFGKSSTIQAISFSHFRANIIRTVVVVANLATSVLAVWFPPKILISPSTVTISAWSIVIMYVGNVIAVFVVATFEVRSHVGKKNG